MPKNKTDLSAITERWKRVHYASQFRVSSLGRVRDGSDHTVRSFVRNGALTVRLAGKDYRLARLVADAFMPAPVDFGRNPALRFRDGNALNASLANLEWRKPVLVARMEAGHA